VVDLQLAEPQDAGARRRRGDGGPLDAAQQYVHPRGQLTHGEGLRHVVVGADPEPDQHVGLVVARGEHQYGYGPLGLYAPAYFQPVEAGQHDVEDQQIGLPGLGGVDGGRPVARGLHEKSLCAQTGRDGVDDRRVVLDHENPALGARSRRRAVLGGVCLLHRPPLKCAFRNLWGGSLAALVRA
jgi:hypothetical protein